MYVGNQKQYKWKQEQDYVDKSQREENGLEKKNQPIVNLSITCIIFLTNKLKTRIFHSHV